MNRHDNRFKSIVVAARLNVATYTLLTHISQHTKLKKSTLIKAAVTQWLKNAPTDLPLDLKIELTRYNIQHTINTIKNLRWTYHKGREATVKLRHIEKAEAHDYPPHTLQVLKQLETEIAKAKNELDTWLKQQHNREETPQ